MKKYTKPTINVVELSVKESLSALPSNILRTVTVAQNNVNYLATVYSAGTGGKKATVE